MNTGKCREEWEKAYNNASFYQSRQSTIAYWNEVAGKGGAGLAGTEHLKLLEKLLNNCGVLDGTKTMLDVGCGTGDYELYYSRFFKTITANDNAEIMIEKCKNNCDMNGLDNVEFCVADYKSLDESKKYDVVFACLNPSTYCPEGLEKLLELSSGIVVYLSMNTSLEGCDREPVYRGTNSVVFAEEYLKERGIEYLKEAFIYADKIPFAYLIVKK